MDRRLGQRLAGLGVDVALEAVLEGHRLGDTEVAEIPEVGALFELGDGRRDLIDAARGHALCLLQVLEVFALDALVLGVVLTHLLQAPRPSDHSERGWRYLLGVCWPAAQSRTKSLPMPRRRAS